MAAVKFKEYSLWCVYVKDKKSFSRLAEKVSEFIATYDSNEEYKQYVQSGTSGTGSKENVK